MLISIVMPIYHEEKNILKTLAKTTNSINSKNELLLVYDYEEDPTVPVIKKYLKSHKHTQVRLVKNSTATGRGVLNAIKTGFIRARGSAIVVVMADLSDDIKLVDKMAALLDKGYDIVCASRYSSGGKKIGGPFLKTLMSRAAGLSLYYLFGVPTKDATNAYKMYRRRVLKNITIESKGGFEYSLEITLKAFKHGYKITEIPTVWKDRVAGESNFKLLDWLPSYIKQYFLVLK